MTAAVTGMSGSYPPYINAEVSPSTGEVRVILRGDRNPLTGECGPTAVGTFTHDEWDRFKKELLA